MIVILIFLLFLYSYAPVFATNMSSSDYKLQWTNLNMTSGSKSSANYQILDTVGQTAPGEYASSGYYVKAGFPYIKTIIPFTFTISDLSIDFGHLTANAFATQTNTLTVSAGGAGGYTVTAAENHPLKMQTSAITVADTTCNSGACSETSAGVWNDTSKTGFGYNMSGNDVPAAFADNTYFKQFSDASLSETGQVVMSSVNVGSSRLATVTYKVNIGPTQAAGDYENSITFTATPGY